MHAKSSVYCKEISSGKGDNAQIKRTAFYDNLKFILMAFVVTGHFLGMFTGESLMLKAAWRWIYSFHMPAFLYVGGMFAKRLYAPNTGLRVNVITFYLLMGLLLYTGLWLESSLYSHPEYNLFVVGSIPWYFFVMAALGASTPIVAKIRGGAKVVVPASVVVALAFGFSPYNGDFLCLGRLFSYAPFYFAGYFTDVKGYVSWIEVTRRRVWPVVLAALGMVVLFVALRYLPKTLTGTMAAQATGHNLYSAEGYPEHIDMLVKLLDMIIACTMIVAISLVTPTKSCVFTELGSRTLQVYVAHPFIYYPIKQLGLFTALQASTLWIGFGVILGSWALTALLAWPKWPETLFKKLRACIQMDNAV